ncbi:MAG: formate dehydrogenase accessory protein FdhE [Deltaproteobacteria bacterium]|nr:formate dehydrogenase accessory protein FdhE [Deltaproteobacteria bacterium]
MADELLKETERLIKERPLAGEVLGAFKDLAALMAEEAPEINETSVDKRLQDIKREEGFPLFSRADLPLDLDSAAELLQKFLTILQTRERPDREGLQAALLACTKDDAWSRNLFSMVLRNDEDALVHIADGLDLEAQSLQFLAQMALTPSIQALRDFYAPQIDTDTWDHGYCPFCGSLPSISFFDKAGKRYMHCELCGLEWRFPRLKCPFCSNDDHKNLGYFDVENQEGFRVDFCRQCGRYIKVVDKRVFEKAGPMELENLATLHLDVLAAKEGFK